MILYIEIRKIVSLFNEEFSVFKATKGNFNLTYYTNINDPSIIEFSYSLIDDTQDDVTFLKPSRYVSSSNNIVRYTSQYYEGTSPIRDKKVVAMFLYGKTVGRL